MADLSPLERAGRVRAVASYWEADELMSLVPPGSLILTPDEAERIRDAMRWCPQHDEEWDSGAFALLAGTAQT